MALLKRKRIGLNDAMSVVTKFVNACNRHDADGVASCLHADFDSIQPMYPMRNFRGADQVRRNWQAIFEAEPGFRLTVLRSAAMDDTVWLELHGAGRDAEVAGVFIMGIQGDRIRWARIYSALVEAAPAGMDSQPASRHEVRQSEEAPATGDGEVVEDELIAPVLDMDRSGRRRRRRRSDDDAAGTDSEATAAATAADGATVGAGAEAAPEPLPDDEVAAVGVVEVEAVGVVEAEPVAVALVGADGAAVDIDPDAHVAVAELVIDGGPPEVVAVVVAEPEVAPEVAPDAMVDAEDAGPPTEAVELVTFAEAGPEPDLVHEPEAATPAARGAVTREPPKRRFGKRPRP